MVESEKPKTRGVFALIMREGAILLSLRADHKGWNLPGGKQEAGEDDEATLIREVREETGLDVRVFHQVGPPHVFNDDTAVAYYCEAIGGELRTTPEAVEHRYVMREQLRDLKIVGPEGRLGRMGRMIYDGLSLQLEAVVGPCQLPVDCRSTDGMFATDDGLRLFEETDSERREWRRLDPYSSTGFLEATA